MSADEKAHYAARDPLPKLATYLIDNGLATQEDLDAIVAKASVCRAPPIDRYLTLSMSFRLTQLSRTPSNSPTRAATLIRINCGSASSPIPRALESTLMVSGSTPSSRRPHPTISSRAESGSRVFAIYNVFSRALASWTEWIRRCGPCCDRTSVIDVFATV